MNYGGVSKENMVQYAQYGLLAAVAFGVGWYVGRCGMKKEGFILPDITDPCYRYNVQADVVVPRSGRGGYNQIGGNPKYE